MRALTPHLRRALLISKAIGVEQAESATFAAVLDRLSAAIFLVDAGGGVLHANAAARAILAAEDLLYSVRGRISARDTAAERSLRARFAAAAVGDSADPTIIGIPLISRDEERYVAHVLPLAPGGERRGATPNNAVAALLVHRRDLGAISPPEAIAQQYKLTPAELRVLLAIVNVGGGPEVAEALGIGSGTVKTHLHRLYEKTGTSRQAESRQACRQFCKSFAAGPGAERAWADRGPTSVRRRRACRRRRGLRGYGASS